MSSTTSSTHQEMSQKRLLMASLSRDGEEERERQREEERRRAYALTRQLLQNQTTSLRLEMYSVAAIRLLIIVVVVVDVSCIVLGIFVSSFALVTSSTRLDGLEIEKADYETRAFVLYAEAITRTVACALSMLVLLYFGFSVAKHYLKQYRQKSAAQSLLDRVTDNRTTPAVDAAEGVLRTALVAETALERAAVRFVQQVGGVADEQVEQERMLQDNQWRHFNEQILILFWVLMICMNPTASIWGIVEFWEDLIFGFAGLFGQFQIVFFARSRVQDATFTASVVFTALAVTALHFFLYGMLHFQDRRTAIARKMRSREMTAAQASMKVKLLRLDSFQLKELEDFEATRQQRLRGRIKTRWTRLHGKSSAYFKNVNVGVFYGLEWAFIIPLAFYCGLTIGAALYLRFHPSFVPIVSFITLIRVCTLNSAELVSRVNQTIYSGDNSSVYSISYQSGISSDFGVCSPLQPSVNAFRITIVVSILVAFDIYFFVLLWRKMLKTRYNLSLLTYDSSRSDQLGFSYFRLLTWLTCLSLFTLATVVCIIEPLTSYLISNIQFAKGPSPNVSLVSFDITPFTQVGIGPLVYGFGCCYLILAVNLAQVSFGFVPFESLRSENVMYLPGETDVAVLSQMAENELHQDPAHKHNDLRPILKELHKQKSARVLRNAHVEAEVEAQEKTQLESQIESGVFILETAVLMYHFMSLSYDMCELKLDVTQDITQQMGKLVEDQRFELCLYADDADTDTHAFVFVSNDRVVVSFRGSVSFKNYKTDWDSTEVEATNSVNVVPLLDDEVNVAYSKRIAAKKPYVHGGFVKTYATVGERIKAKVNELMTEPGFRRCLFVTGHSLGGGLAVVCAFDLGVSLKIAPSRIALITWGCPKVGTFSYVKRVHRVIPCAHRIATANDVITQLPFQAPYHDWTLKGWHHVGTEIILLANGNMVLRPSPIESYMIHSIKSSVTAHFRLSYAVALAAWVIRSNPDMKADWWLSVIESFTMYGDFSPLPGEIRERLMWDLRRPGAPYFLGGTLVRDQAVDTTLAIEMVLSAQEQGSGITMQKLGKFEDRETLLERLIAAREDEEHFLETLREYLKTHNVIVQEDLNGSEKPETAMPQTVHNMHDRPADDENDDAGFVDALDNV